MLQRCAFVMALLAVATLVVGQTIATNRLPGGTQPAGTLQATITTGGANATIVLPTDYSETTSSTITISANNVTLRCEFGAMIKAGGPETLLNVTGYGDKVLGCIWNQNLQGNNTKSFITFSGAVNPTFMWNFVENVATGMYAVEAANVVGGTFADNHIDNNVRTTAFSFGGTTSHNVIISHNFIDVSAAPLGGSIFHGGAGGIGIGPAGSTAFFPGFYGFTVVNNVITVATEFCVEIGGQAAAPTHTISVTGNTCYIKNTAGSNSCESGPASKACGGFSFPGTPPTNSSNAGVQGLTLTGNTVYGEGQNIDIGCIELPGVSGSTVSGNTCYGSGLSTQHDAAIEAEALAGSTITGNTLVGWGAGYQSEAGIGLGSNYSTYASDNIVTGNTIVFPPFTSLSQNGITVYCGAASSVSTNNTITGNTIKGNGHGTGIAVNNNSGGTCTAEASINGNSLATLSTGVQIANNAGATATIGSNEFATDVTTQVSNYGNAILTSRVPPTISNHGTLTYYFPLASRAHSPRSP